MKIPTSEHGYTVDPEGSVHKRYADHARGNRRTRTAEGAHALAHGKPTLCRDCFPVQKRAKR